MHTVIDAFPEDSVATLRQSLVTICDGHHCAAMLLDYLYEETLVRAHIGLRDEGHVKTDDLVSLLSGLFNTDDIYDALQRLEDKAYGVFTTVYYPGYPEPIEYIRYVVDIQRVDEILTQLLPPQKEIFTQPITPPAPQVIREIPLEQRYRTESARVMYHNRRAEDYGLPATLTLEQWIATLEHFEWKCAYCRGKYAVLEHFVPLGYEEGTTWSNCVPACNKCNGTKGPYHPKAFPPKMMEKWGGILSNVQQYLETRRDEAE